MTTPAPQNPNTTKPADDPDTHWRESLAQAPYYKAGYSFDDYAPAYRAGRDRVAAQTGGRNLFVKAKSGADAPNNLAVVTDRRTHALRFVVLPDGDQQQPVYRLTVKAPTQPKPASGL